ncbi:MAG TPA: DUF4038 domain-containing protein, partial [Chloroflexota bacterium]|nr:DUF4038 domain-containing protein [Chloroflexota bacterium]
MRLACVLALLLALLSGESAPPIFRAQAVIGPTFIQQAFATPQSTLASVSVSYPLAETAGDLNVVVVGWNDTSAAITSVRDSAGNHYSVAVPTQGASGISQAIYDAPTIVGGSDTVTVTFSPAAFIPDIRLLEYSGVGGTILDGVASAAGSTASPNSGAFSTSAAGDLVVAGGTTWMGFTGAGSGYTLRTITQPDMDLVEDLVAGAAGSYTASAPLNGAGPWVMQAVAFRVGPTATPTVTGTATNTPTSTPMATSTAIPTITSTPLPGATGTSTPLPTSTATLPPVPTSTSTPTPVPASSGIAWPLKASANGRYLTDQNGIPFLVVGDSPQSLIGNLSEADAATYFANRHADGFTAVWINLLCDSYTFCNSNGTTSDGIAPFTTSGDLSTPNPAYFQRVDDLIRLAAQYGLTVFLDPAETGGWLGTLRGN